MLMSSALSCIFPDIFFIPNLKATYYKYLYILLSIYSDVQFVLCYRGRSNVQFVL